MATPLEDMIRSSAWPPCLSEAEPRLLLQETYERHGPAGGPAMRPGEPADHWLGVILGRVNMSVSQADGRLATFAGVTTGGWAGEGLLLKPGRWGYDDVAVRPSHLACVPRRSFKRLVASTLAFNHHLLGQLNARLSLFVGQVAFNRLQGPDAPVARCVASLFDSALCPRAGEQVKLSQHELGLLSGRSANGPSRRCASWHVRGSCPSTLPASRCGTWPARTAARQRRWACRVSPGWRGWPEGQNTRLPPRADESDNSPP
jgi:CRP/FNR family transcriptional regulator, cyclic AMP receptor protein